MCKVPISTGQNALSVLIVMPAYNAARTLRKTYNDIPTAFRENILLVDDASQDETIAVAGALGIRYIAREKNGGYGANQKTCYQQALRDGAETVVMLHPDYQYDPQALPDLIEPIVQGRFDVMFGSRISGEAALEGGMPLYKYIANRFLTTVENSVLRTKLTDLHTGLRAYRREVLESINFLDNSDNFVFDSQVIAQIVSAGFTIGEIPIRCRYEADSSCINFRRSVVYGVQTLWTLVRYRLHKMGLSNDGLFTVRKVIGDGEKALAGS